MLHIHWLRIGADDNVGLWLRPCGGERARERVLAERHTVERPFRGKAGGGCGLLLGEELCFHAIPVGLHLVNISVTGCVLILSAPNFILVSFDFPHPGQALFRERPGYVCFFMLHVAHLRVRRGFQRRSGRDIAGHSNQQFYTCR